MDTLKNPFESIVDHVQKGNYHHLLAQLRCTKHTQSELDQAIQIATSNGFLDCTRILINFGADLNCCNEKLNGAPLLLGIALGGHCEVLELLVEYGYDVNYKIENSSNTNYAIPLHVAVLRNDIKMLKCLLSADCNTEFRDSQGNTAVLLCCILGSLQLLSLLLNQRSDINIQNSRGENCLHLAVKHNHKELVKFLLEFDVNINCEDENGDTPIMVAAAKVKDDVDVFLLLLKQPELNLDHQNNDGNTVLHVLAPFANVSLLQICISHNCNLFSTDNFGNSVLNIAACFGNEELVFYLLMKHQNWNLSQRGYLGRTVIHWIVVNNMEKTMQCIKSLPNIDFNVRDDDGNTPFMLSVKGNYQAISEILLGCGSDPNQVDTNGWSALHWACQKGYIMQVKFLIYKCNPHMITNKKETCLMFAAKENHLDVLKVLLQQPAYEKHLEKTDYLGKTVLHFAVQNNSIEMMIYLLDNGCISLLNKTDTEGNTVLNLSVLSGETEIMRILLNYGASPNIIDRSGSTPVYYMTKHGKFEAVNLLLNHQADINKDEVSSPLIEASKQDSIKLVAQLLSHGSDIEKRDKYGRTALMWASFQNHLEIVKLLHSHGADPKVIDDSGDTPLTLAAFQGCCDVVDYLIPLSDIDHRELEDGMSALLLALSNGHKICAEMILKAGADINIAGDNGNDALLTAVAANVGLSIIQQILDTKLSKDLSKKGYQGRNVLHWAVANLKVLNLLLDSEFDLCLDEADENGATPLLLAIAHSFKQSAIALINANCSFEKMLKDGRKPIHHTAIYGETEVLQCLLQKGASPLSLTMDNRSPLLLASIEGNESCVNVLLKSGAAAFINNIYLDAITPLSVAVNGSYYNTIRTLLVSGAKPDLIGSKKHRPILTAIVKDDYKSVKMLLQWGADIETGDDLNNHPITVAAVKHRCNILILLLYALTNTNITRSILKGGAIYYFVLDETVRQFLQGYVNEPPSLMNISRMVIRTHVKIPLYSNLQKLFLGSFLRNFLLFDV